jgi:phosphoribosylaminoimidazolecarboxamide formyltransferase / IMP cyclohydrolase
MGEVKIKTALISVYHKDNLEPIIRELDRQGVKIISTSGTKDFIESLGVIVISVEGLTSYPSILGGRVKTLHPKIFGGILSRRDNFNDKSQINEYDIPEIDLVIVDLYPFEETVKSSASNDEIIEKIDIGGISLIRATAKNHSDVVIISSRDQYKDFYNLLVSKKGFTGLEERIFYAGEAFKNTSGYDSVIFNYFNKDKQEIFDRRINKSYKLRYGENPHQKGIFYGDIDEIFEKLSGKEISYNNITDIDGAINLISEFEKITFAIIKHTNPCGLATRKTSLEAWNDAFSVDTLSAFGGIIITNSILDARTAEEITKIFFEVIIAPEYEEKALEILKEKKNRIVLKLKKFTAPDHEFKTALNGVIFQEKDKLNIIENQFVTEEKANAEELEDLLFANKIVKHSKSNAIVIAKNKQLLASGIGQTSRIDALNQAIEKAKNRNLDLNNAVLASDAYFPFADSVEAADKAGIKAIIQPGGSVRDKD